MKSSPGILVNRPRDGCISILRDTCSGIHPVFQEAYERKIMTDEVRSLASIQKILNIQPIPKADAIEVATVNGWKVVVKKGEFSIGDLCVYIEIDSWVPNTLAPFLSKGQAPREYEGIVGERLRTVKLRGQVSQGLILPLSVLDVSSFYRTELKVAKATGVEPIGVNVTEALGIVKYDPPVPACLAGIMKGPWPSSVPKTDQERIQNLGEELPGWKSRNLHFEASEKLDGSSGTFFLGLDFDEFDVCSRNINLVENDSNSFWKIANTYKLKNKMQEALLNGVAIQGELVGEGIQDNKYGLKGQEFFVYDIYDTRRGCYMEASWRIHYCELLGLKHVPIVDVKFALNEDTTQESILAYVVGKSELNPAVTREGVVFKCLEDPSISFKGISNEFLLTYGE